MTTSETPPAPSAPAPDSASAAAPAGKERRRIGEVLVEQGVLTADQLTAALAAQKDVEEGQPRLRLGQVIITRGFATERQIAEALAMALTLPLVDLGRTLVVPDAVRLLPRAVAERSGVLVLEREGDRLVVATADPTNVMALDDVKLYTGISELKVVVATDSQVRDHLARAWSLSEDSSDMSTMFQEIGQAEEIESEASVQAVDAAPIVRLVDVVLADAVRARASDVHVEPQAHDLRIRYRVDGLLRDVMTVPKGATAAAVSRIKIVSGLDIAERRKPQDGRAKLVVDGLSVEARISTLPTLHGEKVVIRLLPRAENVPLLSKTGLTPEQRDVVSAALVQTQGLVLITGPTGSGKTNTLYAAIQEVSTPERNIVTLEDPVEVQVKGITQVQVNPKSGLTFAAGLRSVLRQDPDVVLVGEVRDHETAELALQASLTGHLVLTTLHTNDAVSAITRLVDMGVPPFLVASSLTLVVAQRLVRRPCPACIAPYVPEARTLAMLGLRQDDVAGATPMRGGGCSDCGGTGYKGRTGIFEVLPITSQLRSVLLATPTEAAISASARAQGMTTLRASAIAAAHRGETTYEEVLRATTVDSDAGNRCGVCARGLSDDMLVCPWDGTPVRTGGCGGCDRTLAEEWTTCPWCRTPVGGFVVRQAPMRTAPVSREGDEPPVRRADDLPWPEPTTLLEVEPAVPVALEPVALEPPAPETLMLETLVLETLMPEPLVLEPLMPEPPALEPLVLAPEGVEPLLAPAADPVVPAPLLLDDDVLPALEPLLPLPADVLSSFVEAQAAAEARATAGPDLGLPVVALLDSTITDVPTAHAEVLDEAAAAQAEYEAQLAVYEAQVAAQAEYEAQLAAYEAAQAAEVIAVDEADAGVDLSAQVDVPSGPPAEADTDDPTQATAPDDAQPVLAADPTPEPAVDVVAPAPAVDVPAARVPEQPLLPVLLVAHEDPIVGTALATVLAGRAQVLVAHDASSALAALESAPVVAALLDDDLPDLSGIEVLEMLRADGSTVPVLVTGAPEDEDVAVRAGAEAYAVLPAPPRVLGDRLLALALDLARV